MEYTGDIVTYTSMYDPVKYLSLDLGGGFTYKLSDKIRLYGEAEYTMQAITLEWYATINSKGIFQGSPSLRIGAQFEL